MQPPPPPHRLARILLAEDDPDHQDILCRVLTQGRPHVKVDRVASAGDLDRAVRTATFDCIVLDYNLPDQTADQAIKNSRYFLGQTPVVVVSSSLDEDIVLRSARAGGVDFLKKSDAMRPDELWNRVSRAINESLAKLDRNIAARLRLKSNEPDSENQRSRQDAPPAGDTPPPAGADPA